MDEVTLRSKDKNWSLSNGLTVIGRGSECDVHINDGRLSRKHAELRWDGRELVIRDLDSRNGTLVNGRRISEHTSCKHGDIIIIGPLACYVMYSSGAALNHIEEAMNESESVSNSTSKNRKTSNAYQPSSDRRDRHRTEEMDATVMDTDAQRIASAAYSEPTNNKERTDPRAALEPAPMEDDAPSLIAAEITEAIKARASKSNRPATQVDPPSSSELLTPDSESFDIPGSDDAFAPSTLRSEKEKSNSALRPKTNKVSASGPQSVLLNEEPTLLSNAGEVSGGSRLAQQPSQVGQRGSSGSKIGVITSPMQVVPFRIVAAVLDGGLFAIIVGLFCLPCILGSYALALLECKAGVLNNLPVLHITRPAASWSDILMGLLEPGGLAHAFDLVTHIRDQSEQAFLYLFLGVVAALILFVLIILLYFIAPTTFKGAPLWHRTLGLMIIERKNGFYPTPVRACVRWFLAIGLAPLAPFFLLFGRPALHDVLSGCRVRPQPA